MKGQTGVPVFFAVFVFAAACYAGCNNKAGDHQPGQQVQEKQQYREPELSDPQVKEAIDKLAAANCVDGPAVGIAGTKTDVCKSYEWLVQHAPDTVFINLINHPNPQTRTYAFKALCERKNRETEGIFKSFRSDTTSVCEAEGCIISSAPLNIVWLKYLKRSQEDKTAH
ncbi:MAG: hypothetical protein U0U70_16850 [Chitinophagaceae bacterium]